MKNLIRENFRIKLNTCLFYEHPLDTWVKEESKIPVSLRILDINNISDPILEKRFSIETLKKRLENGDKCFLTEKSGRLSSFHWLQTNGKHYIGPTGEWKDIQPGTAVIYHVFVEEKFRGNKINGMVYSEILGYCKDNDIDQVWIYTDSKNSANRKGLEKLGFKIYKQTCSLKFRHRYIFANQNYFRFFNKAFTARIFTE
ncbi:GNAT family N-acetyltransferase [Formosa sp. PL04]|uniref:GNAT family N-acetyltransferase n=1 Tax=Formosa sp. PL04 TaxID=3081755 RepID=UPI002981397C|nr:GNAT family N-acetyltransferase [Formosa sp. PL04]MDW5290744.1 GNAT family N-acetyltransferase [Formosa sp. PL04]